MEALLLRALEERGYVGRVVSIDRLRDLEDEIEGRHRGGAFDEGFYQDNLTNFVFDLPESIPGARSLIVVSVRQPVVRFTFSWKGERVPVVVPPTYLHWAATDRQVEDFLDRVLSAGGYRVATMLVPKKLLAVRSGLAEYGRNNITYVPGRGSFHRLVALCSNMPCEDETWQEPQMMERCENCVACLRKCPSGAIPSERFLLGAERCLVYHNEQPGEIPFPSWMEAGWHNCLVGCLHCQTVCPENAGVLGWTEDGAAFSAVETTRLMAGVPLEELPEETAEKLAVHDLVDLMDLMPRNLAALFEARAARAWAWR